MLPVQSMGGATQRFGRLSLLVICAAVMAVFSFSHVAEGAEQTSALQLQKMDVMLWPEYDDPRLLVIYQGRFSTEVEFPQQVRMLVPKGAEIGMVCALPPSGEHLCQRYETVDVGDYTAIDFTLPMPDFTLEFYHDSIDGAVDKSISYRFAAPYDIEKLEVSVQQPLKATDFQTKPEAADKVIDRAGFTNSLFSYAGLPPEEPVELKISYTKEDPSPSVEKPQDETLLPPAGSTSTGGPASASGTGLSGPPFDFGGMVLPLVGLLLTGFVVYWLVSKRPEPAPARAGAGRAVRADRSAGRKGETTTDGSGRKGAPRGSPAPDSVCFRCKGPVRPDDNFCAYCGSEV